MSEFVVASDLAIEYRTPRGAVRALDGADLRVAAGASMGLVGESGSGKTTLGMAMGRLLPSNARRVAGSLSVGSQSLFDLDDDGVASLRRRQLGFVFQNPMSALNPTARIGKQIGWALERKANQREIHERLQQVGLRDVPRVAHAYPHELSGGMAQRVVIAMAIARRPRLLVADEPTASLDASVRGQILELIKSLQREIGATLILLSHELSMVARTCDVVGVMYGGRVVEAGPASIVFNAPLHPYTQALLKAAPGAERPGERLTAIPGMPPVLIAASVGCSFAARCHLADETCRRTRPEVRHLPDRQVACHHIEAASPRGGAGALDPS
jgi:oligopeptide/dipeptide ABC transporter ATP-binding protein